MDDFNDTMESAQPELTYQSEITASENPADGEPTASPVEHTAQQQQHATDETQSVPANHDDMSTATNESTELGENQSDDKYAANTNEKDTDNPVEEANDGNLDTDNDKESQDKMIDASSDAHIHSNDTITEVNDKRNDEIDMNQCRICLSSENLLDIFRIGEKTSFRLCDLIMKIAPSVKISERDYLPHSVCDRCVNRIEAAYELRIQCEDSDKLLRSKLKRSKKTRRSAAEFVLIDCAESSSDSDDDQKSDEEFQISEESEESSDSDSNSSYDEKKKRLPIQRKRGPPPKRPPAQPVKKPKNSGVVYIKATKCDGDKMTSKIQVSAKSTTNRLQFRCDTCNRPCATAEALAQHRKIHADEKCEICGMRFKKPWELQKHMQRHRDDPERICQKCQRVFGTKVECQRHCQTAHPATSVSCHKCKRYFSNKSQHDAHKCTTDRKSTESSSKQKNDVDTSVSGRDLFKSVAPLTTTYWSDSFSD